MTDVNKSLKDLLASDKLLEAEILSIVGSVEHYRNDRHITRKLLSLGLEAENKSSFFMRILDALIKFLVRMADDVFNGSAGINLNLNRLISRAEEINTTSRSSRRTNKEGTFKLDSRLQNLSINYKLINDPQRILMYLKTVDSVTRKYFKYQDDELLKAIPAIMTLRPTDKNAIESLANILNNVSPVAFATSAGFSAGEYRMVGPHLLGNQQLSVINKNPTGELHEQLLGQEFVLQPSDAEPKSPPEYAEFDVFAKTIEQSILRQVIATATDLVNHTGLFARQRRSGRISDLVRYLESLRNDVSSGKYQGIDLANATSFILMLEAFDNWLVNPYLSLLSLMVRNLSAILNMCEANN